MGETFGMKRIDEKNRKYWNVYMLLDSARNDTPANRLWIASFKYVEDAASFIDMKAER